MALTCLCPAIERALIFSRYFFGRETFGHRITGL